MIGRGRAGARRNRAVPAAAAPPRGSDSAHVERPRRVELP
jgi:hypothetical protein